jgi:hypothetical protein
MLPNYLTMAIVLRLARHLRAQVFAIGFVLMSLGHAAYAQTAWPTIALPQDVSAFEIGKQVNVNGLPMRMRGFVSALKPVQLAEWFRQHMGKPLVENTLANKLILGRVQDEYYLMVQLEPAGNGTRGVTAVTHLKAAYDNQAENRVNAEHWLSRLPAGPRLLSKMTSEDAGKVSTYLLVTNTQSENLNRDRLKSLMHDDGFEFEQESVLDDQAAARLPAGRANGKTLYFKGQGKEAMATISRDRDGHTAIVLNTISQMGRFK